VPGPLPKALRTRILKAWLDKEGTWEQLAERFKVGIATIDRLVALYRETGSVDPRPHGGGHEPKLGEEHLAVLRELVTARPDITLEELAVELVARGGPAVSTATIGRAVRDKLGLTRKKSRPSLRSESGRRSLPAAKSSRGNSTPSRPRSSSSSTRAARTSR
jgi:transposase